MSRAGPLIRFRDWIDFGFSWLEVAIQLLPFCAHLEHCTARPVRCDMLKSLAANDLTKRCCLLSLVIFSLAISGCDKRGSSGNGAPISSVAARASSPSVENRAVGARQSSPGALAVRLASIDNAVGLWRRANDLHEAHAAAEEARNLIVGPEGPYYGDADRDGVIRGSSAIGLLPARSGQVGLAQSVDGPCVVRDILGGSWEQPIQRWSMLEVAISRWTTSRNTMPSLASHPQRIVGWATLALASDQLSTARTFGEHAQIHSNVSRAAVAACEL